MSCSLRELAQSVAGCHRPAQALDVEIDIAERLPGRASGDDAAAQRAGKPVDNRVKSSSAPSASPASSVGLARACATDIQCHRQRYGNCRRPQAVVSVVCAGEQRWRGATAALAWDWFVKRTQGDGRHPW
jgi:hypothetical protein